MAPTYIALGSFVVYNDSMSFNLVASTFNPTGLFPFEDVPLMNYAPSLVNGSYTGTPSYHPAMINGAKKALVFSSVSVAKIPATVFVSPKESKNFSMVVTAKISGTDTTTPIQVLGHTGQMDGITITGSVISFVTKYVNSGESSCTYDMQVPQAVNIAAVHTNEKNSLYVNGMLVDESPITAAQQNDVYVANDGFLYVGMSSSTNTKVAVNGVVLFDRAITFPTISILHNIADDTKTVSEVASQMGGQEFVLSKNVADYFINDNWSTDDDWNRGFLSGVAVKDSLLVPQFNVDTSIAGSWFNSVSLANAGVTSIYGVNLNWDGIGMNVAVSLDGTTWTNVVRNVNIPITPPGFDPTNKELFIRVSFPGGVIGDTSYLRSLQIFGTKSATPPIVDNRVITLSKATFQKDTLINDFNDQCGVFIDVGGSLTIGADTSSNATLTRTVEIWIKATTTTNPTVNVTGTYYQDGLTSTVTLPTGEWTVFHIVAGADFNSDITITGPAQVGPVVLYSENMTAARIAQALSLYTRANQLSIPDATQIKFTQVPDAANIYAHDWSIVSSG